MYKVIRDDLPALMKIMIESIHSFNQQEKLVSSRR